MIFMERYADILRANLMEFIAGVYDWLDRLGDACFCDGGIRNILTG